jgi:hypothetical protein
MDKYDLSDKQQAEIESYGEPDDRPFSLGSLWLFLTPAVGLVGGLAVCMVVGLDGQDGLLVISVMAVIAGGIGLIVWLWRSLAILRLRHRNRRRAAIVRAKPPTEATPEPSPAALPESPPAPLPLHPNSTPHPGRSLRRFLIIGAGIIALWFAARFIVPALDLPHPHVWGRWGKAQVAPSEVAWMYEQRNCLLCGARQNRVWKQ